MVRERGERPVNPVPPKEPDERVVPASPINWWTLDSYEQVEVLWTVNQFVKELVTRYGLKEAVVPPCWFKHEALVQELLALFQYRNQMQYIRTAPASAPIDFHYYFQLSMGRLRNWTSESGCTMNEHRETRLASWALSGRSKNAEHEQDFQEHLTTLERKADAEDEA